MSLQDITKQLAGAFEGKDSGLGKRFKIDFGDDGCIFIDATANPNTVSNANDDADTTLRISMEDYQKLLSGELNGQMAFMSGKLKIDGDLGGAMALGHFMESRG